MSAMSMNGWLLFSLAAASCVPAQDAAGRESHLLSPASPVDAVRDVFNAAAGTPRFVAVLSPT